MVSKLSCTNLLHGTEKQPTIKKGLITALKNDLCFSLFILSLLDFGHKNCGILGS